MVLALDYDRTIARDGVLNGDVRHAIAEARSRGIAVLIVTGRILDDLRRSAGDLRFVDAIVAENGAVIAFPESGQSTVLAAAPSQVLTDDLRASGVPFEVGECVLETDANVRPAHPRIDTPCRAAVRARLQSQPSHGATDWCQ